MEGKKENLTREYIIKAFEKLLESNDFDKLSVCDIVEKAGVSRMSFYRNFKSKEDLVFQLFDELTKELRTNIINLETKNQYTILKEYFEIFKKYKNQILSLANSNISKTIGTTMIQKFHSNVPHDYMSKTSKYIPIYYFSAITHVLIQWLVDGTNESTDEMARLICSLKPDIQ